jgi:hypothetical protein
MPKKLAMIGLALVVVSLLLLWGTDHWLSTRTFKPVDIPISVDTEKAETGNFLINVSGKFLISIEHGEKAETPYNVRGCPGPWISDVKWKLFRAADEGSEESWPSDYSRLGSSYGAFDGVPGTYRLDVQWRRGEPCFNESGPRLVVASSSYFYEQNCAELANL